MKRILFALVLALAAFTACQKEDFWARFGPEVLFYQYNRVETADFIEYTLEPGVTEYLVKARCSAPNELARIEVFRNGNSIKVIEDFSDLVKPTECFLNEMITGISSTTVIRVTATDKNGKQFSKEFTIKVG
jgi:hypothetical protein